MKKLILFPLAIVFSVVGVIGLLIPVIPGVLFLLAALVCLGLVFPSLRQHLEQQPRLKRFFLRLDKTRYLGLAARCKLLFWALLEMVTPGRRRI